MMTKAISCGTRIRKAKTLRIIVLLVLCSCLTFPLPIFAQSEAAGGSIEGIVTDSSGAVLPGVAVEVRNSDTGFTRSLVTNEVGRYTAPLLAVGTYEVTAQLSGFGTVKVSDVLLQVGQRRVVEISMKISALAETITVDGGQVPIVETSRVVSTTTIDDRAVHDLPTLARNFQSFVLITPGTMLASRTGTEANFSIAGQKGIYSGFSLDGADYSNAFYGGQSGGDRPPFTISLEAIKEFVVLSNGFNAEFGRSGGGIINAVTKSGTNQLQGNGFWFFQDKSMVRDDAFGRPPLGRRQQFGATAGGPIKQNELFFFVAWDNQRRHTPINLVFDGQPILQAAAASSDPDRRAAAQAILGKQQQISASDNLWSILSKVDWTINNKHNLSARYNVARNRQENGTSGLPLQRAASIENFGIEGPSVYAVSVGLSSVVSAKTVNELRLSRNHEDRPRLLDPNNFSGSTTERNGVIGGAFATITGIGTVGPSSILPSPSNEIRYQLSDNFSYTFGNHDVKFGGESHFISKYNFFRNGARGQFTFFNFDNFVARRPDQYFQFFGSGETTILTRDFAAFVQDAWRAKPGLTINYGLRWEGIRNPKGDLPNADFRLETTNLPNDFKQWSPRLGIAWDPKNDRKSVVRFFSGYLYAPLKTLLWANVLRQNGDVSNGLQYTVLRTADPSLLPVFNSYTGPWETPFDRYPGTITQTQGTVPGANVNLADQDFHNARVFRTNASFEREVVRDLTVTVTYDYSFTTGTARRRDWNLFPGTPDPVTGRVIYDRSKRPYPFAAQVVSREATGKGRYQGLTVAARKRFSSRFQLQTYYVYAQNFSDSDAEDLSGANEGYDQLNLDLEWGRSNLDIRHNYVFNGVFELPLGIEFSPILRAQSGRPFNAVTGTDNANAYQLSADALANFRSYIGDPTAVVYGGGNADSNASNDRPIVNGTLLRRNAFEQPGTFQTDLRVAKRFRRLQLMADLFNVFNNANKFTSNTNISLSSFGSLNNADAPFAVQFGLRYAW